MIDSVLKRKGLLKVTRIFHKPAVKRTEEDVQYATEFLVRHQLELGFFRGKSRARIEALCRVMGVATYNPNCMVFDAGVSWRVW
jgi:hypothetical protein